MDRLGKMIYENAWGYKVYMVLLQEIASTRISIELYTVSPEGKMSDTISIQRQDIICKKNTLDFFFNLDGDFKQHDIDSIKYAIKQNLGIDRKIDTTIQHKYTMDGLHQAFSDYIRKNAQELYDNSEAGIFIKDGYGYLKTDRIADFIKVHEELGYKKLDILKRLKIMGALKNGANRPYDTLVSIGGVKKRFYKIQLAEEKVTEEKADEVIKIDN